MRDGTEERWRGARMRKLTLGLAVGVLALLSTAGRASAAPAAALTSVGSLSRVASSASHGATQHRHGGPSVPRPPVSRPPVRQARPVARARHASRSTSHPHAFLPASSDMVPPLEAACQVLLTTFAGTLRLGGLRFTERGPPIAKRMVSGPNRVRTTVSNAAPLRCGPPAHLRFATLSPSHSRFAPRARARARPPPLRASHPELPWIPFVERARRCPRP